MIEQIVISGNDGFSSCLPGKGNKIVIPWIAQQCLNFRRVRLGNGRLRNAGDDLC